MSAAALRIVPPRGAVAVLHRVSPHDLVTRRDVLTLEFERRIRYRRGGGSWRDDDRRRTGPRLPWIVHLAVPLIAEWTGDTVAEVLAIARAQLTARGATGRRRITARVDSYAVNVLTVIVRVGDLRATFRIDAGQITFAVPLAVVAHLAALDPHRDLHDAVTYVRARAAPAAR